jgi:hypothetical protein
MGLLLVQLAAYLDPDAADLQLRSLRIRPCQLWPHE